MERIVEAESDEGAAGSARPRANADDVEVEEKKAVELESIV